MEINYNKLKGRIIEKYGSFYNFADALGVSKVSLSKKMNGHSGFSRDDIVKWCGLLSIDRNDLEAYFFATDLNEV